RLYQGPNHGNGGVLCLVENRRESSRRLIFPRSFAGSASTTKIRFGTCQLLSAPRQNCRRSVSLTSAAATTQAATSSLRNTDSRPKTTACRTPGKRSKCASTSAGFTFLPATLITSEIRPTILNPEPARVSKSSGTKIPLPNFSSSGSGKYTQPTSSLL